MRDRPTNAVSFEPWKELLDLNDLLAIVMIRYVHEDRSAGEINGLN